MKTQEATGQQEQEEAGGQQEQEQEKEGEAAVGQGIRGGCPTPSGGRGVGEVKALQ